MRLLGTFLLIATAALGASAEQSRQGEVLAAITTDLDRDGSTDAVFLGRSSEDAADLYIVFSIDAPEVRKHVIRDLVWAGSVAGTLPSLATAGEPEGAITLTSGNLAIGRYRWEEVLTIVARNGLPVLHSFEYSERDTLRPGSDVSCARVLHGDGVPDLVLTGRDDLMAMRDMPTCRGE